MIEKMIGFIKYHMIITALIVLDILLFLSLIPMQGVLFIVLSIIFWIIFMIVIGALIILRMTVLMKQKQQKQGISSVRVTTERRFKTVVICIILVVVGFFGFITYSTMFIPNFKGYLNEEYLVDTVHEIIQGKITDYEKVSAILAWFDQKKTNMHNSWHLTHSGKSYWTIPGTYVIFFTEEPYVCYRCFDDNDPRWILTGRCGACGEYSRLFMIMADRLGFEVRRVHAQGEDHVWNEIMIDGAWIPVDSTNVSLPDGGDGWEDYGFFEHKEGNASLIWAEYLHNDTIEDLTSLYTPVTNVTLHCIDENNRSLSNVTITLISHNLKRDPYHETFIKNKPKPKTNESGYCTVCIGGGNYTFQAVGENNKFTGERKWVTFSDEIPSYDFTIVLKVNEK